MSGRYHAPLGTGHYGVGHYGGTVLIFYCCLFYYCCFELVVTLPTKHTYDLQSTIIPLKEINNILHKALLLHKALFRKSCSKSL